MLRLNKINMKITNYKNLISKSLLLTGLITYSNVPTLAVELKEHSATYIAKIKKGVSIDGEATRSLRKIDSNKWLYSFEVESFVADISERSLIIENEYGIQPLDYNYKLSAFLLPDRKRQVLFDWESNTATSKLRKTKWQLTNIPTNTYDRLSYQLQLLLDVDSQKKTMIYNVAHKAKLRESQFVILGEEKISTKHGKLDSIIAKKQRDKDAKRETFLWFSKDYPLLLLKMTQKEKDGEEYEIELSSASIEGKPVSFNSLVAK